MARFRKIDPKIWNDAKFTALSNDAKLLFIYLLTSPMMTVLGAVPMRSPAVAAELGFDLKRYAIRYKELYDMGIVEYDDRGLFWVKNFLKYNSPDNPKVVISWSGALDLLPECALLKKVIENAKIHCNQRGKGFPEAFENSIGNRSAYGIDNSITYPMAYREKEKEREKDIYIPASESASASSSASEEPRRAEKKTSVIQKPEGVELDDWSAFLKLRKEKKMPLTKRALDLMHAEGKKANLSMQQVIVKCLEESWAGFKASWLENKPVEKHEESSIHKVRNPGPPPSKDDDGWKAQEAYFKSLNMFKGAS